MRRGLYNTSTSRSQISRWPWVFETIPKIVILNLMSCMVSKQEFLCCASEEAFSLQFLKISGNAA